MSAHATIIPFKSLGLVRLLNVFEVSYAHQGCIYIIKHTLTATLLGTPVQLLGNTNS